MLASKAMFTSTSTSNIHSANNLVIQKIPEPTTAKMTHRNRHENCLGVILEQTRQAATIWEPRCATICCLSPFTLATISSTRLIGHPSLVAFFKCSMLLIRRKNLRPQTTPHQPIRQAAEAHLRLNFITCHSRETSQR